MYIVEIAPPPQIPALSAGPLSSEKLQELDLAMVVRLGLKNLVFSTFHNYMSSREPSMLTKICQGS